MLPAPLVSSWAFSGAVASADSTGGAAATASAGVVVATSASVGVAAGGSARARGVMLLLRGLEAHQKKTRSLDSMSRDGKHVWPAVGSAYRGALGFLRAGIHVLRHSRTCVLGLPKAAANAFAVLLLKGIRPSPGGDSLILVIFAGQHPQGGGYTMHPE